MEIYDNRVCLTGEEVWSVLGSNFNTLLSRRRVRNLTGRACYCRSGLYDVDDFPNNKRRRYRDELYAAYPELSSWKSLHEKAEYRCAILKNIVPDPTATSFFKAYMKPDGKALTEEECTRYINSAMTMNAIRRVYEKCYSAHAKAGRLHQFHKGDVFRKISETMYEVDAEYPLSFKSFSARRLQEVFQEYGDNNYSSLLSGKYGNLNHKKKNSKRIAQIVLSIYGSKDKVFVSDVVKIYNEFLLGQREVYNRETGELYDRNDFYHNGEPETLSKTAVWKIINDPLNRKVVDRLRNDFHYNQNKHNADVQRRSPYFSLSKISFDDYDLVRKVIATRENKVTGKIEQYETTLHAYYAFDVASDVCIGAAYSLGKDKNLIEDCMRNMWANLRQWGLLNPYEFEVENHLIKGTELEEKFRNTCMELTFCAPMNSREKRAEHKIKAKKWHGEDSAVKRGMARGRHYARHEAYLYKQEKVFDELNNTFKNPVKAMPVDWVIREDQAQMEAYNNALHTGVEDKKSKKKRYPGMTRMQVLLSNPNRDKCAPLDWRRICLEWGIRRETSVKRGRSVTVDYREWWLSSPDVITKFKPNNMNCVAYWIPEQDNIREIYLYQDGRYIDRPGEVGRFQEAIAERTDEDIAIMNRQLGFISGAKKLAREHRGEMILGSLGMMKTAQVTRAIEAAEAVEVPAPAIDASPPAGDDEPGYGYADYTDEDWAARALISI
jgi:hypothetical protein